MTTEATTKPERGFASGELVVLRPVLKDDLPELAKLLAANPFDDAPQPWTLQRLKKQFEDKDGDGSGLWGKERRTFAVTRLGGGIVGFLKEESENDPAVYWNRLYIGEQHPDRHALGEDALKTYLAYKRKWHNPRRISFDILKVEIADAQWLVAAGFALEIEQASILLYQGQPATLCTYAWLSEDLISKLADDGPVMGEEAS